MSHSGHLQTFSNLPFVELLSAPHTLPGLGFSGGSSGKQSACDGGNVASISGWEDPRRRAWQPTPVFLPGEVHRQRSLAGYSPWGHKESDTTERLTICPPGMIARIPGHCLQRLQAGPKGTCPSTRQ